MTGLIYERSLEEKLYDQLVLARVKKGIALLEEKHGPDWVEHIDMETLQLRDGSACILGQIYAEEGRKNGDDGFGYACDHLLEPLNDDDGSAHGFSIDDDNESYSFGGLYIAQKVQWDALQQCWEDELRLLKS